MLVDGSLGLPSLPGQVPGIDLSSKFGRVIRRRRKKLGLSQEELAGRAGLHRTYVSLIERGIRNPTLVTMVMLADGLRTTLGALVKELEAFS